VCVVFCCHLLLCAAALLCSPWASKMLSPPAALLCSTLLCSALPSCCSALLPCSALHTLPCPSEHSTPPSVSQSRHHGLHQSNLSRRETYMPLLTSARPLLETRTSDSIHTHPHTPTHTHTQYSTW
jgi:hypothetical protein